MYLLGRYINDLIEADIEGLILNDIPESKVLDYKRQLNIDDDKEKNRQEFLFDITSFYNTDGGCLVYGISEKKDSRGNNTGHPDQFVNQEIENVEILKQRIHDIVRVHTDPNITNIIIREFHIQGCLIVAIGIQRGLGMPAMVTINNSNRFYKRNNIGKYLVSTIELNNMFIQNQLISERANQFKDRRIQEIREFELIPNIHNRGSYFLHVIPFSFLEEKLIDLRQLENQKFERLVNPIFIRILDSETSGYSSCYNLDGYMNYRVNGRKHKMTAFNQYFRNGIIEFYTSSLMWLTENSDAEMKHFYGYEIISATVDAIQRSLQAFKILQVEPPLLVYISLFDTDDAFLLGRHNQDTDGRFSRNCISLPAAIFSEAEMKDVDIFNRLKNHFDIIWQAAGARESPNASAFSWPSGV